MTIKTITAGHSRKEGRPNFGSEGYDFSFTIDVEPGEDLTELAKSMFETCKDKVNEQFAAGKVTDEVQKVTPDWKQVLNERLAERNNDHGSDNGPRGSKFGE